ncbi:MAG: translation initiation factor IF-2 [Candidatus Bruticola sp.]
MSSNTNAGGKIRVYELARELGIEDSKSLINILRGMGYPVKTAANSIPNEAVQKVRETVTPHLEQLRREAQAKNRAMEEEAQAKAAASKPAVRIAKRATQEEKQALIERKVNRHEDNIAARPIRTSNVKVRQTAGAFRRATLNGGLRPIPRSISPALRAQETANKLAAEEERAQQAAREAAEKAAREAAEREAAAQEAARQAAEKEAKEAAEREAAAREAAEKEAAEREAAEKEAAQRAILAKEQNRKRSSNKRLIDDVYDEENEKELVDLPIISPEEMGIQQDESISLSTPMTGISIEDAFSSSDFTAPRAVFEGGRGGRNSGEGRLPRNKGGHNSAQQSRNSMNGRGGSQSHTSQGRGQVRSNAQGRGANNNQRGGAANRGGANQRGQRGNTPNRNGQRNQHNQTQPSTVQPQEKTIVIPEVISLADLATRMGRPANNLISTFVRQGKMVSINQALSYEEARDLAISYGYKVGEMSTEDVPLELIDGDEGNVTPRPPVISVLGHVDHGKTSLLDAIRRTSVVSGEAGGITQTIGAYTVIHDGRKVTFIDTPGHEAFTQMRARGAAITDIAILVVAANDGVMPQTVEAINHARAANLPIIVAINKIDLPESNPDRVMTQLTEYGLLAEEWGGDTIMCKISAKRNIGLNDLLDLVILQADTMNLMANPHAKAQGTIIEGSIDKGRGPVATVLVQNGTLKVGDTVVVGKTWGRLRAMLNEKGKGIRSAGPSVPVEIVGLEAVPDAGDHLQVVEDEKMARQVSEARTTKARHTRINSNSRQTLEGLFADLKNGVAKDLKLLVKAESHGSLQALIQSLNKLSTDEVAVKIIHSGVGAISETDVMLASASKAIIIGFNVRPGALVKRSADMEEVEIRTYRIIYEVIEHIKKAMSGLLTPDIEEVVLGKAEVRQVFKISKIGKVAGCYVTEGKVVRGALCRLLRDNVVIYDSTVETLRRFKDDAREVVEGFECGLTVANYADLQEGDIVECYQKVEHQREL